MAGQQEVAHGSTCVSAVRRPGWKPSRFFEAWKEKVISTKGRGVAGHYMYYCRGMPADIRKEAIKYIMRTTLPLVYVSDDRAEAFDAMDNDADAIREYAARFLDEFWDDYWKPILAEYDHIVANPPQPPSA